MLTNCGLISEGLDVPGVVGAILLRPTKSLALYLQQVGRALRPAPGMSKALILDHAGNTYRHGLVDAPRAWSLDGRAKTRAGSCGADGAPLQGMRGAQSDIGAQLARPVGAPLRLPVPRVEVKTPTLVEIDRLAMMSYREAVAWAGTSEDRLRLVARARGYKRGWVWHRLQEARGGGDAA